MYISEILESDVIDEEVKDVIKEMMDNYYLSDYTLILTPTDSNNDINGSQHAVGGGTDFTYRPVTVQDVNNALRVGFYEYFSNYQGVYTGHYYQGDNSHFAALVIDPPKYASAIYI